MALRHGWGAEAKAVMTLYETPLLPRHFCYPAEVWSHGWRAETSAVMTLYETSLPHKKDTSVTKTLPLPRRGLEPRLESGDKGGGVGQVDMMPASLYHHKLLSPRCLQVCV